MNLKTEMLLLNKPPITNKIVLNLDYNKSTQKFRVKEVVVSSGEEQIDNMIKNTVNNVLNNNEELTEEMFKKVEDPNRPLFSAETARKIMNHIEEKKNKQCH